MGPTFCLGDFDITVITYRHLLLQSKRYMAPPACVRPVCIHYKKTFEAYLFFASFMIGQCRQLEAVRALGTDERRHFAVLLNTSLVLLNIPLTFCMFIKM